MSLAETKVSTPAEPPSINGATECIWAARSGVGGECYLVYDSSDRIVLAFPDASDFPGSPSAREQHEEAAQEWSKLSGTALPDAEGYAVLESGFERDWSVRIAEKYDRPLAMLDYGVTFHDPRWDQYGASISGYAEIPGAHGTLRTEVKVQGFATHRSDATDTVRMWSSLTHLETGHVFYADRESSFEVPDVETYETYPLVPAVLTGVYNTLFSEISTYRSRLTDCFTVCERCGVFDDDSEESGLPVLSVIDPDGGWQTQYCRQCYSQVLHNEYGVLPVVAEMYVEHIQGATYSGIAKKHGESKQYVQEMVERLDTAVQSGSGF